MCQSQKKRRRRKSSWGGGYKVVKCRTLWRIALVHSAAVTYAPWSPHARTYTRTTQGPVCVSRRHSCLSIIYTFSACIAPIIPIWCYQIQCLTKAKASCADLVLPPSYPVWVPIRGLSRTSPRTILSRWTAWTNLTHADRIPSPSSPFKISISQFSFWPNQCIATRL